MSFLFEGEQGDPATIEDAKLFQLDPVGPRRLYFIWENQHWSSSAVDLSRDREDWEQLQEDQKTILSQSIATFFAGEERVATAFAPIILSADDEQEAAFLATQQADEARHMHFFDRVWREVLGTSEATTSAALKSARARCNDAFDELFDRRLLKAVDRLRLSPRDTDAKVEAVTIYHLIIEGMLGLTGMHFLIDYFEKKGILPNVAATMKKVKQDEHRHVAWGTWFLRSRCRVRDRDGFLVQNTLMELLPVAAGVLIEGGQAVCDGLDPVEFLGYPSARLNLLALESLSRRLKVIGGATEEIQRFVASGVWRASRVV